MDWVFPCPWVKSISWGFLSVYGCDPQAFLDFQVLGSRLCCFAARVFFVLRSSFRYWVTSGSPCGIILRIVIPTGLMCLDCSGVTTENSAICDCFSIRYGDSVVLVTLTAILLSIIVDFEWEISRYAVSDILQRCHSPRCVPFWRMVNEGCYRFCCRWWYSQGIISDDWLWFCSCFAWGRLNLHCQVLKIYEAVCRVNDYTVVPHKMQPNFWPHLSLHYDKEFSKGIVSNFKCEGGCCQRFF